jgi:hypothetical protein
MASCFRRSALLVSVIAAALALSVRAGAQEADAPEPDEKPASPGPTPRPQPAAPDATARRAPRPGDVQKVFVIRHAFASDLATLLAVFPATIEHARFDPQTSAISVSASPAVLAAIEETIKRLDLPENSHGMTSTGRSIEVTGYVVEGTAQASDTAGMPPVLADVLAQLKRVFSYGGYRLVDTLIARPREGSRFEVNALASNAGDAQFGPASYSLEALASVGSRDGTPLILFRDLRFGGQVPIHMGATFTYRSIGIHGDIEIHDGQRVVVGKSGLGDGANALILILSAKVVD